MEQNVKDEFYKHYSEKVPNICYLTLAGSKSYGTNNENSDTDIRGFYLETKEQLFGLTKYSTEYTDSENDTVLYSFKKFLHLLSNCNPNVIELLGTRNEDVLYMTALSREMRMNAEMFLSKRAYVTFGGYAVQQLRRLQNALSRTDNKLKEEQLLKTLNQQIVENVDELSALGKYELHIDEELKISANVKDISLRDFLNSNAILNNTMRNFDKIGHRNNKKDENHLNKHAMHLIRLYYMGIDILKNGVINTYREKEHDLLMTIRNGEMSFDKVFEMRDKLEVELQKAYEESKLPETADMNKINKFCIDVLNTNLRWE